MLADDAHAEGPPRKRFRLSDLNNFGVHDEIIIATRPVLSHLPRDVLLDIRLKPLCSLCSSTS